MKNGFLKRRSPPPKEWPRDARAEWELNSVLCDYFDEIHNHEAHIRVLANAIATIFYTRDISDASIKMVAEYIQKRVDKDRRGDELSDEGIEFKDLDPMEP